MLTVYCKEITSRVSYTFTLVFNKILGVEVYVTKDQKEFDKAIGAKFVYGFNANGNEILVRSAGLLTSEGIKEQNINVEEHEGIPCFFCVDGPSVIPFDPFSASFYMATRYEEYLSHSKDNFGRFEPSQSLAYRNGFLRKPIVQIWALKLAKILKSRFPDFQYKLPDFTFINTLDIDNAFAYKGKGLLRSLGGMGKSLLKLNFNDLFLRMNVLFLEASDPFDNFEMIGRLTEEYKSKTICFILQGKYGKYDKNLSHNSPHQISMVKKLAEFSEIGLHPSYASNKYPDRLKQEKDQLENIIQMPITKSRQHYLILSFPETYRHLIDQGITDDYSMGFAAEPGFRAGLSISFPFYDLLEEKETGLTIHPFALMDRTFKDYLKICPNEAMELIEEILNELIKTGGQLISVWHNESLNENDEWKGWSEVYRYLQANALSL